MEESTVIFVSMIIDGVGVAVGSVIDFTCAFLIGKKVLLMTIDIVHTLPIIRKSVLRW